MTAINVTVLYNKHKYSINYRKLMLCLPDGNLKKKPENLLIYTVQANDYLSTTYDRVLTLIRWCL